MKRNNFVSIMLNLLLTIGLWSHPAMALNSCLEDAEFVDRTGRAEISIANDNMSNPLLYRPRCVTVSEGTLIRFRALPNFGMHPLFGGTVVEGVATIDPLSPIGSINSGQEAERLWFGNGEFPFFCDVHFGGGMMGSIRVVPQLFASGFD